MDGGSHHTGFLRVIRRFVLLVLTVPIAVTTGCEHSAPPSVSSVIEIQGMTCGQCVESIQHAVKDIPGVVSCSVSLDDGTGSMVTETDEARIQVIGRIRALGFTVPTED